MEAKEKKYVTGSGSLYQMIAEKFATSANYVGEINRGIRKPVRGKGLAIKIELEKYNLKKHYEKVPQKNCPVLLQLQKI